MPRLRMRQRVTFDLRTRARCCDESRCSLPAAGKAAGTSLRGSPWSGDHRGRRAGLPLDRVPGGGGETTVRARQRSPGGRGAIQERRGESYKGIQAL